MISVVIRLHWEFKGIGTLCLKQKFGSIGAAEAFMQSAAASNSFLEAHEEKTPEQSLYVNVKYVAYFRCYK